MVEWINLTGHLVKVYDSKGKNVRMVIYPAGKTVRIISKVRGQSYIDGVPVVEDEYVEVINLPDPEPGKIYIVSTPVLEYLRSKGMCRDDVVAPDTGPDSVVKVKVKGGWKKVGVRRFRRCKNGG